MSLNLELTRYMKKLQGYTRIKKLILNDLLELNNSVTIHQRNLQTLATKIFRLKNNSAPEVMTEVFEIKEPHYTVCSCHVTYTFQSESTLYIVA